MKIRHILLALTVFLGAALLVAVTFQIRTEARHFVEARGLVASNAVREQLLLGAAALAEERTLTYLALVRPQAKAAEGVAAARNQADRALASARALLARAPGGVRERAGGPDEVGALVEEIVRLRAEADAAPGEAEVGRQLASRWFRDATRAIDEVRALRLTLLSREQPADPLVRAEALLRDYGGVLGESVARNQALLAHALLAPERFESAELRTVEGNLGRAGLAWDLMEDQIGPGAAEPVRAALSDLREHYASTLEPLQQAVLRNLAGRVPTSVSPDQWQGAASQSLRLLARVREALFASSRARLDAQLAGARTSLAVWSFLLLAGAVAVALSLHVVRSRIIRPIESIGGTMLRLADNDLDAPLPKTGRTDEIGDMTEALRVFKANAIRRSRLQHDKHLLHERLKDAYRQLRRDLDAAAVMQTAMLPPPGRVSQVAYDALFRPSSVIAGDTYGVVPMEGRIAFFQVDVAGHGAPAALVSVASHHTLSQALLRHGGGDGLHEVVARINREWAEELPYFTMVLGEIDVEAERGALVQAGHPPPLLIAREGDVTTLGDGGFPVGLMSQAIFEATRFRFRPGDRLMVYSDGLVEAENESGEPFSDERLQALVRAEAGLATGPLLRRLDAELRRWRGSETLSDDMSVLVLERLRGEAG